MIEESKNEVTQEEVKQEINEVDKEATKEELREEVKAEPKEEVKAAASVIAKNQMLDIFSFVEHRHKVILKIKQINKRHYIWVALDDPCLNQLRRHQVKVSVTTNQEMRGLNLMRL